VLGARTERDAQIGPVLAGYLKVLPVFLMVLPGVIAYVLFRDLIGSDANQTLPVLISQLVPTGLKG
jgi:solute:Na+ symporter, SSS family